MSKINGMSVINMPTYDGVNQSGSENNQKTDGNFSEILSDMLKEQALQSTLMKMSGSTGNSNGLGGANAMLGGLGGLSGTNAMIGGLGGLGGIDGMGGLMPSISSGMENTLISAAGSGEMSGAQLMLFMMIMMMQSGNMAGGGSDMAPIMQMLAGMLSKFSDDTSSNSPNNMVNLVDIQEDTKDGIKRMVDAALAEVGYQEKSKDGSGNITKFGAWYGMDGQPWCAMFVSWAADQAGILNDVVPKHASTARGVAAYQEIGLYSPRDSGYQPREGDAIYFHSNGRISHVGIVVAFDPDTQKVYTVEGNTNNSVRIRNYDLSNPGIHGFGRNGGTSFGVIPTSSSSGSGANTV